MALSKYPTFMDGDVLISTPRGEHFKLHSSHLQASSPIFARLLTGAPNWASSKKDLSTIRWRLKMVPLMANSRLVNFVARDPKSRDNSQASNDAGDERGRDVVDYRHYDNFFRCIYNLDLNTRGRTELHNMVTDGQALLECAEQVEAAHVVRNTIESHFLRHGQALWLDIESQPEVWADLAVRLRSPPMFREAMCHLVGAWNMPAKVSKQFLCYLPTGKKIKELVDLKVSKLNTVKKGIEARVMTYWPDGMKHSNALDGKEPGRTSYANDIYSWMALTLLRQYNGEAIANELNYLRDDGGAQLYCQIGVGNAAYLDRPALKPSYQSFQMSKKSATCFEDHLQILKEQIKYFTAELLVDRTQSTRTSSDVPGGPEDGPANSAAKYRRPSAKGNVMFRYTYLTCIEIQDNEMPWLSQDGHDARRDLDGAGENTRCSIEDEDSDSPDGAIMIGRGLLGNGVSSTLTQQQRESLASRLSAGFYTAISAEEAEEEVRRRSGNI